MIRDLLRSICDSTQRGRDVLTVAEIHALFPGALEAAGAAPGISDFVLQGWPIEYYITDDGQLAGSLKSFPKARPDIWDGSKWLYWHNDYGYYSQW